MDGFSAPSALVVSEWLAPRPRGWLGKCLRSGSSFIRAHRGGTFFLGFGLAVRTDGEDPPICAGIEHHPWRGIQLGPRYPAAVTGHSFGHRGMLVVNVAAGKSIRLTDEPRRSFSVDGDAGARLERENARIEPKIKVPKTLRGAHSVVQVTRERAVELKQNEDGRLDIGRAPGIAHLQVSRQQLNRALRILQAIIAEAERRGYAINPIEKSYNHAAGVAVSVRGQNYALSVYELRDKVPLTATEIAKWDRDHRWSSDFQKSGPPKSRPSANGRLGVSIAHSYGSGRRSNWREGPRGPLEGKLQSIFEELEGRAVEDEQRAARLAIEREKRESRQEAERERQRNAQIDSARGERLTAEAKAWRTSEDMRAYLAALRTRLADLEPDERGRLQIWINWAEAWVERGDPVAYPELIEGLDPSVLRP